MGRHLWLRRLLDWVGVIVQSDILYRSVMVDQLEQLVRYEPVFASREAPEDQMTRRRGDLNTVFERNSRKRQRVASKTS